MIIVFKIEELVFKIENYNHIYLSLKQKLASVKSDIEKERNKLLSRNTRKAKTTDILRSQKMKRVKSAYETDEMVPIHESDKFIKYHDNFFDN
jgi:GTP cyclohydrolase II